MSGYHLIKVPFRADALVRIARQRRLPLRELDEGHLVHSVLRELWQERAPAPFLLRGHGRVIDAWGYSTSDGDALREHARDFGDPDLLEAVHGGGDAIASKPMPLFPGGRRLGFLVRVCPVVRLAKGAKGREGDKGREVDAFLAACWRAGPAVAVSREKVYVSWFQTRVTPERAGARLERVAVDAFRRERFVRRTQRNESGERAAKTIERPDVRLSGELVVENPTVFAELLRHGLGRHKAFGFGMLLLVPPGRAWDAPGDTLRDQARSC